MRGLQEVPDSSRLQRIGEVIASMDEDSDGIVKVEHVNKVIEILGRDNVQLSGKQVKQIIDLIGKEEMLEVENKIEKILGKIPVVEVRAEMDVADAVKKKMEESDLTEDAGVHVLEDKATELEDREMEEHIAQLFSRPETGKTDPSKKVESLSPESSQILSRASEDNSVKDVTDTVKKEEEELEKIPQKNGSSKH